MDEIMVASEYFPWWGSLLITGGITGVFAGICAWQRVEGLVPHTIGFGALVGVLAFTFPAFNFIVAPYDLSASSAMLAVQAESEYGMTLDADTAEMLIATVDNGERPEDGLVEEYQAVQFVDEQGEDQVLQLIWRGNAWMLAGEDGEQLEPQPDSGWR